MTKLSELHTYGNELRDMLLLKTYPVAIKLLEKESGIPKAAIRPKRDLGYHLALCQGIAMARREGSMVAMVKSDHWCYVPVIALGHAKPPKFVLDGNMEYPGRVADLKVARKLAKDADHLEYGKYAAIVMAPLKSTVFQPDLVIIYCNPMQLRFLLGAMRYKDGRQFVTSLEPGGACVNATVPVLKNGECKVTIPCMGDARLAIAQEDEIIFTISNQKLEDLMMGARHFNATGASVYPVKYAMSMESPPMESYRKAGKLIGLEM